MTNEDEIHRLAQAIVRLYGPHHPYQTRVASVGAAVGMIAADNADPAGFIDAVGKVAHIVVADMSSPDEQLQ